MVLSVVLAMAGPFLMKGPDGQALMNLRDLIPMPSSMPSLDSFNLSGSENAIQPAGDHAQMVGKQRFYKWKDHNGVWQFSATPPPEGIETKTVDVYPDANIIQSMSKEKINRTLGFTNPKDDFIGGNMPKLKMGDDPLGDNEAGLFPSTVPLNKIPDLINDAKLVQEMMNQRGEMLKNL